MKTALPVALTVALALSSSLVVRAQPDEAAAPVETPDAVALVIEPCGAADLDALAIVDRLRVELVGDGVGAVHLVDEEELAATPADALGLAVLRLTSRPCEPIVATFGVRIDDLLTHKHVERTIDLVEVTPSARPRALALAIAELLRASWAELALVDEPQEGAPAAVVEAMRVRLGGLRDARSLADPSSTLSPEASPPVPARRLATAIAASFVVRAFPGARAALLGGRASLDLAASREVVVRLDLEGAAGSSLDPLGAIDLGLSTFGVTVAFAVALGETVLLTIGPRAAGGVAWASGRPYDPTTLAGTGAGPLVYVGGTLELDVAVA